MTEPVALTYVSCIRCGAFVDVHAATCHECHQLWPQRLGPPQQLAPVRCAGCGDEDGPWGHNNGVLLCESCIETAAS